MKESRIYDMLTFADNMSKVVLEILKCSDCIHCMSEESGNLNCTHEFWSSHFTEYASVSDESLPEVGTIADNCMCFSRKKDA